MTGEARGNRKDRDANQDEGTQRHEHATADNQTQNQIAAHRHRGTGLNQRTSMTSAEICADAVAQSSFVAARNSLTFIRSPRDACPADHHRIVAQFAMRSTSYKSNNISGIQAVRIQYVTNLDMSTKRTGIMLVTCFETKCRPLSSRHTLRAISVAVAMPATGCFG